MRECHFPYSSAQGLGLKLGLHLSLVPYSQQCDLGKITSPVRDSLSESVKSDQGPEAWSMFSKWQALLLSPGSRVWQLMAHMLIFHQRSIIYKSLVFCLCCSVLDASGELTWGHVRAYRESVCHFAWLGCMGQRWTELPHWPAGLRGAPQSLKIIGSSASWKVSAGQEETILQSPLGFHRDFKQEQEACVELSYCSFIDWGTEVQSDSALSSFGRPSIFLFLNVTYSGMWLSWGVALSMPLGPRVVACLLSSDELLWEWIVLRICSASLGFHEGPLNLTVTCL